MKKQQPELFSQHEHALEKEFELCPSCGCELQIKNSKHGPFLGCSNYPSCEYSRPLVVQENLEQQIITGSVCPKCSHELAIKKGRYGIFIGCTNYPDCHHIEHQNVEDTISCPQCSKGNLVQRVSRYGKSFYACDAYPKCKYVTNYHPIDECCPDCGWGILIERKGSAGHRILCPVKQCSYKRNA